MTLHHKGAQFDEPNRHTIAYNIGWDAGLYGLPFYESWPVDFRTGYAAARKRHPRPKRSDRFIRKWIQLRAGAYSRNKLFSDQVTPNYLRMIDQGICPVTFDSLTHGEGLDTDWSIDRVNNDVGYERHNLITLSTRANKAKSDLSFDEIIEVLQKGHAVPGLSNIESFRLGNLLTPYFKQECEDVTALDNYYRGFIIPPDMPINGMMGLQFLLSFSIDPNVKLSGVQPVARHCAKCAGNKRLYSKMMSRLCRDKARMPRITAVVFPEWAYLANVKNLSKWLERLPGPSRRYLRRMGKEISQRANDMTLETNLERWAKPTRGAS